MRIDGIGGAGYPRAIRESDSLLEPGTISRPGGIASPVGPPSSLGPASGQPAATSFGEALTQAIDRVNGLQAEADQQAQAVATGEAQDLHTAMIAMERAEIALQATVQITQKAIDAYKEISRMQV